MLRTPQCWRCKHFIKAGGCRAFPKKIPPEILTNRHRHTKPYPGDNGILFEPHDHESEKNKPIK